MSGSEEIIDQRDRWRKIHAVKNILLARNLLIDNQGGIVVKRTLRGQVLNLFSRTLLWVVQLYYLPDVVSIFSISVLVSAVLLANRWSS